MAQTRAQLEQENARLWEKLEAIYDEIHELFPASNEEDEQRDEEE